MIIKSKAGTEIAKNGYTVIDELNQIPMIKTNYLQLEHNHINPIIVGSKAFEHKDIFVNVVEDTETSGDTAFKEYNAIHEFAWVLSGMRKHDSYTGYLSLEQYLTMVLEGTDFTYQVEGGHQYYALQFENLGDGESHLDMFFKMLSRWNTEFELRGKKVYITHQRGRLRDKHVGRYKMNIIDTIINSDITDGATAVWGYFGKKDEENPENSTYREFYWQIDELVEQYGIRYAKPYSNENITQEETMIEYLNNILLDSWKISTEVDIAEITDDVVHTGDEYVAVDERLGITLNTRIQKLESVYDADDKLLYQTATLGTVSFASASSGSSSQLQEVIEKIKKDYNDRITDLKQEFDNRFNDEVTQIEIDFNELVNGVRQEIQADKEAFELQYEADKQALSGQIQDSYDNAVTEANRIVEAKETDFKNYADGIGNAANGRIDSLYEGLGDLSTEFENLSFENRNLLLGTGDFSYGFISEIPKNILVKENGKTWIKLGVVWNIYQKVKVNVGETYTFSFNAKSSSEENSIAYTPIKEKDLTWNSYKQTPVTKDEKRYSFSFVPKTDEVEIYLLKANRNFPDVLFSEIKLEKGTIPTDWTPSPEDVEQRLTIIANDLDGVQTKVEDNIGNISTVTQLANGLETRVSNAEGDITSVTNLANGIQTRVTDAEGNINTITNLANGTQQTVTNMLNGTATKGTVFQNTVDGFLNRAWQTDIDALQIGGRNLLEDSTNMNNSWETEVNSYKYLLRPRIQSITPKVKVGDTLTFSLDIEAEDTTAISIYDSNGNPSMSFGSHNFVVQKGKQRISFTATLKESSSKSTTWYMDIYNNNNGIKFSISKIKIEKGNKATDWSPAPEDLMKYTDIIARPDGFLIGSFEMGGDKIAQAIVGKAGAIDLIADNVNFTGNVNVANQIKTYSLEAVYADIAKLRTNILTANSVEATALKVDTALIKKLNTNSILTNYLIANTAMINNIKSKSLEAVYANISELRTRMLVADVITANMVKFDTALIEKFTSSTAFINSLTAKSAFIRDIKAIDIDLNRATVTGGDSTNYIRMTNQTVMSYGTFTRSWAGETDTARLELGLYDGQLRMRNLDTGYRLYLTERGLSTSMAGAIDQFTSGTLEFHSQRFNANSRGITMHSSYGTVAMVSDYSTAVIRSNLTANIESDEYSVYIRPTRLSRNGLNEFAFYVKANDSSQETDGTLLFGDLTGANTSGSGLRFSKRRNLNTVYVTNINGDIGTGDISVRDAEIRGSIRTIGGLDVRTWDGTGYNQLRVGTVNTYNSIVFASYSGGNAYFGVASNEMRVTDNNGYNGGNTSYRDIRYMNAQLLGHIAHHGTGGWFYIGAGGTNGVRFTNNNWSDGGYKNIQFQEWKAWSSESAKTEIEKWNLNVLDVIKDELQLYRYKFKQNVGSEYSKFSHGIILRNNPNEDEFPVEWRDEEAFNGNEVMWWTVKGVQELAHENDTLKDRINDLENKLNKIMEMIV